jgi:hypothetical protein
VKAAWSLLLPVGAFAACVFPDVGIDEGAGTGGTSPTTDASSSTTTTGPGGAGSTTTTTMSSSSSGDGGGTLNDGGGGSTSSFVVGSGGAGGSIGPGGTGFCPAGDFEGCQYDVEAPGGGGAGGAPPGQGGAGGASVAELDCDADGDPNGRDCEPCNADVFEDQTAFFTAPYITQTREESFDYDCDDAVRPEHPFSNASCTSVNAVTCIGTTKYFSADPGCGKPGTIETCGLELSDCVADEVEQVTIACN